MMLGLLSQGKNRILQINDRFRRFRKSDHLPSGSFDTLRAAHDLNRLEGNVVLRMQTD